MKLSRALEKHKIALGTEITDNLRQDQGDYASFANTFNAARTSSLIWALYAQDEFAITHELTLRAWLRYDHYSDFAGTANPQSALGVDLPFVPTRWEKFSSQDYR